MNSRGKGGQRSYGNGHYPLEGKTESLVITGEKVMKNKRIIWIGINGSYNTGSGNRKQIVKKNRIINY